jgi:hypothetical protein
MKRSFAVAFGLALIACSLLAQAPTPLPTPNPVIGVWKQNLEKSTYSPGPPPPMGFASVRQYAAGQDGSIVAVTFNLSNAGIPSLGAISAANYDGKDYPQHTVATLATSLSSHIGPRIERTISYRQVNLYTVEITQKQNGVVVAVSTRTITRDGQTMTDRSDFTGPDGQRVMNVLVFEKQ